MPGSHFGTTQMYLAQLLCCVRHVWADQSVKTGYLKTEADVNETEHFWEYSAAALDHMRKPVFCFEH